MLIFVSFKNLSKALVRITYPPGTLSFELINSPNDAPFPPARLTSRFFYLILNFEYIS